jgi:putative transposase
MIETHNLSVARSCRYIGLSRIAYYRQPSDRLQRDRPVIDALSGLTKEFPYSGFWKYDDLLSQRCFPLNYKRTNRVCCILGLNKPRRIKRRLPERDPLPLVVPQQASEIWSTKFMRDTLYGGARYRLFNVINGHNRESVAVEVDISIIAAQLVRVFERLKEASSSPHILCVDNGIVFSGSVFVE